MRETESREQTPDGSSGTSSSSEVQPYRPPWRFAVFATVVTLGGGVVGDFLFDEVTFVVLGLLILGFWSFTVGERAAMASFKNWLYYLRTPAGVVWLVILTCLSAPLVAALLGGIVKVGGTRTAISHSLSSIGISSEIAFLVVSWVFAAFAHVFVFAMGAERERRRARRDPRKRFWK